MPVTVTMLIVCEYSWHILPAPSKIVTMVDREGLTAEMLANEMDRHDCVRMVREFLDKPDSAGVTDVEPATLENMKLEQNGDAIERLTAIDQQWKKGRTTWKLNIRRNLKNLKLSTKESVLDRHVEENNKYENYCTKKKKQKQVLQAELEQRLQAAKTAQPK